jgi:cytochrome c oxidase assembly protein subunit 15
MKSFRLAITAAVAFFFVNFMGFIDTFTASTEGCGKDYPFCNGKLYPDFNDYHSVIEYTHRLVVLVGMLLLFAVSVVAWRKYKTRKVKSLILFAIGGVFAEAVLGALAVYFSSPPLIMAGHIGIALISFAALLNLAYTIREQEEGPAGNPVSKKFKAYAWFSLVYLYLAIYFGAYVASSGAGVMFQGALVPTETYADVHDAFWVDIAHRGIAAGLILLSIGMIFYARRQRRYVGLAITSFVLVMMQGVSGILLVVTHLSLAAILLHVSIVSLMFGFFSLIAVQSAVGASSTKQVEGEATVA